MVVQVPVREVAFEVFVREVEGVGHFPQDAAPAIAAIFENLARVVVRERVRRIAASEAQHLPGPVAALLREQQEFDAANAADKEQQAQLCAAEMNEPADPDSATRWLKEHPDAAWSGTQARIESVLANRRAGREWFVTPRFAVITSHGFRVQPLPMCLLLASEVYRWHTAKRDRTRAPVIVARALCTLGLAPIIERESVQRETKRAAQQVAELAATLTSKRVQRIKGGRYSPKFAGVLCALPKGAPRGPRGSLPEGPAEAYAAMATKLAGTAVLLPTTR